MQSLYLMMFILAFFPSFSLLMTHEPQTLVIPSVYALRLYQDHNLDNHRESGQLDAYSNTRQNSFYEVTYGLSNTSTVSDSSESQGTMLKNSSMVTAPSSPSNGLALKEFPVPLGSRP